MARLLLSASTVLGTTALVCFFVFNETETIVRPVLVFFLLMFCVGWPYIQLINLEDQLAEIVYSVAISISITIIVTEVFVYTREWSVEHNTLTISAIAVAGVVLQTLQVLWQKRFSKG